MPNTSAPALPLHRKIGFSSTPIHTVTNRLLKYHKQHRNKSAAALPQDAAVRFCYGQEWVRKSHQDPAVRFVTAKSGPERATKTRQYDLLRPRVGQKEPAGPGSTICYGQEWPEKSPPRLGSTICCGQEWARKSHQDQAVRFVTAKSGPEKSHQDPAVRFVTAKSGPERATKTRQYDLLAAKSGPQRATKIRRYDLLRPGVGQKEPPRPGSTICYGQEWARNSHQDSTA